MELLTIILTLLFILPISFPFIITRIATYCIRFYLKRKYSISLTIAKCGIISFRSIVISWPANRRQAVAQDEDEQKETTTKVNENEQDGEEEMFSITIDSLRLSSLYFDNSCASILSICMKNITISYPPISYPQRMPAKIGQLEFPFDKIRGDFFKHYKENFNLTLSDICIVSDNFKYVIEKLNVVRSVESQKRLVQVELSRITFSDLSIVSQTEAQQQQPSCDILDGSTVQRVLFVDKLQIIFNTNTGQTNHKNLNVILTGNCFLKCNLEFYINFVELVINIKNLFFIKKSSNHTDHTTVEKVELPDLSRRGGVGVANDEQTSQILNLKFQLDGNLELGAMLDENAESVVCIDTNSLEVNASFPGPKTIHSKEIRLLCDEHTIIACSLATVSYYPSPGITCILDRKQNCCGYKLVDSSNSLLNIEIESVNLQFPYKYNFADVFNEKLMGTIKWLKKYHKKSVVDNSATAAEPTKTDFDISLRIAKFLFEIEDDPFESKLRNNYMLLEDEYHEQLKREQTLQEKINELRRTNLMLASSILDELVRALAKKNSDIYLQRSRQLYSEQQQQQQSKQSPLFSVLVEEADLKILADSSYHKHQDIQSLIRNLNPESQMNVDVKFSTIWCRVISANFKNAECNLRDFNLPMLSMKDLTLKGMILGTEQVASPRARRNCKVYVGRMSEPFVVERSMTPLKIFHNLQLRCTTTSYTHGPCWEPVLQQVSLAFEDIVSASSDPSMPLPWWDKMRFIFHGQVKLNSNQLSVFLHASTDPYNHTELIELTLSRCQIDFTTGKIKMKGDFDTLLRTASKYDECRFIHIPNLDTTINLEWNCLGNPHDHFSIMACAPDKVPDYSSHLTHDSYRSFRSQSLSLSCDLETQFTSPTSSLSSDNMPSMLFFGSTIRWLENQKFIFVGPSKLTRRGKLFANTKPKKPSLSRMFKEVRVGICLNRFQILYWSSVSKRHGIHMIGGEFSHSSEHTLKLISSSSDGLKHRPQADWKTVYMNTCLANVEVWLYNLGYEELDNSNEFNVHANLRSRQYFISFNRVSYHKEAQIIKNQDDMIDEFELSCLEGVSDNLNNDMQSTKSDEHIPNHRLVVHDLKAAWTKENRDVVVGILDAFMNSQQLKKNLSTEALKPLRVESSTTTTNLHQHQATPGQTNTSPPYRHQRHPSTTSLIILNNNPVSSVSKNRAVSMLQKLIADSENNPNVYTEETHSGVASETHLYGVEACQMDDVVDINCLIELVNSQVVLCGTETPGYVIVSAANTEIRQATHVPVWKNQTLLSKTTWTGSLRCMQYYATVDGQFQSTDIRTIFANESDIQWLEPDNIDSKSIVIDFPGLVGSGHSVGGVVSAVVGKLHRSSSNSDNYQAPIQLQRIISRCNCLFYYASHTVGVPDNLQSFIPPLPDDGMFIEPWDKEVGVDSFTLTHQDLDISTNSQQYAMIMDIVNNLLLFVEPHKKTAFEKLERMRFRFQLSADEDQREPISRLQDQVRKYVAYLKRLERERYLIYRASIDASIDATVDDLRLIQSENNQYHVDRIIIDRDNNYRQSLNSLSEEILQVKEQLNTASEELAMMISCFKELQLGAHKAQKQQAAASQQGTGAFFANVIRRNEICFKSARWRVTDFDGQLGLADIVLNNFLYSKVVKNDDSVEHTIELGHLHVSNLIPNQAYKDVLRPTELQANIPLDRQRALRIYCRELAPVAGIPIKEHLEINVVPFTIEVTLQFFQKMVKFFFPEKDVAKDSKRGGLDLSGEHQITSRFGSKRKKDKINNADKNNADLLSLTSSNLETSSLGKGSVGLSNPAMSLSNLRPPPPPQLPPPPLPGEQPPGDTISTMSTATLNSTTTVSSLNSNQRRGEDIEKMRERASKNHTFVYVKIPGIPVKVSYKGKKQKNVTDVKNMSLTLPTYEYHNSTWTWLDLLMAVKNDSKHTVIKQALKQKMKIRPSSLWSKGANNDQLTSSSDTTTAITSSATTNNSSSNEKCTTPVTDEDKARLLLGPYAKKWRTEPESSSNEQTLTRDENK